MHNSNTHTHTHTHTHTYTHTHSIKGVWLSLSTYLVQWIICVPWNNLLSPSPPSCLPRSLISLLVHSYVWLNPHCFWHYIRGNCKAAAQHLLWVECQHIVRNDLKSKVALQTALDVGISSLELLTLKRSRCKMPNMNKKCGWPQQNDVSLATVHKIAPPDLSGMWQKFKYETFFEVHEAPVVCNCHFTSSSPVCFSVLLKYTKMQSGL